VQPHDTEPAQIPAVFHVLQLLQERLVQYPVFRVPSAKHDPLGWDTKGLLHVHCAEKSYLKEDSRISVTVKKGLNGLASSVPTGGSPDSGIPP
jgi:hypothetical protein